MLHNLIAEIAINKIPKKEVAKAAGISQKTLYNKLSGDSDFTTTEIQKIRDTFFPEKTLDYLLKVEESA